jgi:phosphoglycerate kinase
MAWKTLDDMELGGKIVLTRVDINVPMEDGRVTDATRIERIVPTMKDILAKGGKPVLLAHFGRPKGKPVPEMSLRARGPGAGDGAGAEPSPSSNSRPRRAGKPCPAAAWSWSRTPVSRRWRPRTTPRWRSSWPRSAMSSAMTRFPRAPRPCLHRGVAHLLPACAGRLMQAELTALEQGARRSRAPASRRGGRGQGLHQARSFGQPHREGRHAGDRRRHGQHLPCRQGVDVAASLCEHDLGDTARDILAKAETTGANPSCPRTWSWPRNSSRPCGEQHRAATEVPGGTMILDAGPESTRRVIDAIDRAKTLIWNGPLGAFEIAPFDAATNAAAAHAAQRSGAGALLSVAGGGDTVAALNRAGAAERFTYISTAAAPSWNGWRARRFPGSRRSNRARKRIVCATRMDRRGASRLMLSPNAFRPKTFEDP